MAVVALVADLIFQSKVSGTASHLGVPVAVVRTSDQVLEYVPDASGVLADLNVTTGDVLACIQRIKAERPTLPIVAFLSHIQVDLAQQARAAGADRVIPRSELAANLPDILRMLSGDLGEQQSA